MEQPLDHNSTAYINSVNDPNPIKFVISTSAQEYCQSPAVKLASLTLLLGSS